MISFWFLLFTLLSTINVVNFHLSVFFYIFKMILTWILASNFSKMFLKWNFLLELCQYYLEYLRNLWWILSRICEKPFIFFFIYFIEIPKPPRKALFFPFFTILWLKFWSKKHTHFHFLCFHEYVLNKVW